MTACVETALVMFKFSSTDDQFRKRLFHAVLVSGACPDFYCSLGSPDGTGRSYTAFWLPEHAGAVRAWARGLGVHVTDNSADSGSNSDAPPTVKEGRTRDAMTRAPAVGGATLPGDPAAVPLAPGFTRDPVVVPLMPPRVGGPLVLSVDLARPPNSSTGERIGVAGLDGNSLPIVARAMGVGVTFAAGCSEGVVLVRRDATSITCTLIGAIDADATCVNLVIAFYERGRYCGEIKLSVLPEGKSSEAAPFSTARDALRMERDALRAAVERMLPVVAALEVLRDANATSNAIALANDRAMCPDTGAQRRADREEAGAVRGAIAAFDAYRAAAALMKKG